MNKSRRDFLKLAGLASAGLLTGGARRDIEEQMLRPRRLQRFNMYGYAAPALDLVRVGIVGMGSRGNGAARRLNHIEGVEIRAIADVEQSAVDRSLEWMKRDEQFRHTPAAYAGHEESWKRLADRNDIDLIINCTPWHLHTPVCVYGMEQEKHVATEIPAAKTIEECWQLVETSERTRRHCYQITNICYGFFEMVTLKMAREGFFGEIIHGEGAYIHQLMHLNFSKTAYHNMWRLRENAARNGNLYPHHGLGTVAQIMEINNGDRMDFMVSVSSDDFMMGKHTRELAREDDFFREFADKTFRGNMNVSIVRTAGGRTIMLQHDVTSPRPYSRIHLVSGTKGIARAYPRQQIATSHDGWLPEEEFRQVVEKYTPEITRRVGEMARRLGGHGGADSIQMWRLIDCLRNGIPMDLTVYDAATWSAIGPLSEWSVANGSQPVKVPDFTSGAWKSNVTQMDIDLTRGGTTQLI